MARNSGGTFSLPAGNPVVSGTTISSSTHNSTLSDIATEITDSLSRSGKGAMLAPLELTDGSAAAPALTFDNDTDTGVYRKGANNMALVVSGAEVLDVQTAGVDITGYVTLTGQTRLANGTESAPGLCFNGDADSGLYNIAPNNIGLSLNAVKRVDFSTSGVAVTGILSVTGAATLPTLAGNSAMSGSNPASTAGFSNTLTPLNLPKAFATFTGTGTSATQTVSGGFNIASIVLANSGGVGHFTVTFATAMGSANYVITYGTNGPGALCSTVSKATGSFVFQVNDSTSGTGLSVAFNIFVVDFTVFGAQ